MLYQSTVTTKTLMRSVVSSSALVRHATTIVAVVFVLMLLLFAPRSIANSTSLAEQLEQARIHYFSGDLDMARLMFIELEAHEPGEASYYMALIEKASPNPDEANILAHLTLAAELGHAPAMWELGQAYEEGIGVVADLMRAMDWYRASDAASLPDTGEPVFLKEQEGQLIERPVDEVIADLKEQAELNDAGAQYQLARIYDTGHLVPADLARAFKWYSLAAENGHNHSQLVLGYLHCRGIGTAMNQDLANQWLTESGRSAQCESQGTDHE